MINTVTENVVEFDGMRSRAIDQRSSAQTSVASRWYKPGIAVPDLVNKRLCHACRRHQHAAGNSGGEPIDDDAPGMMLGVVRQVVKIDRYSVATENFLKHWRSSVLPKYSHGLGVRHPASAKFDDLSGYALSPQSEFR